MTPPSFNNCRQLLVKIRLSPPPSPFSWTILKQISDTHISLASASLRLSQDEEMQGFSHSVTRVNNTLKRGVTLEHGVFWSSFHISPIVPNISSQHDKGVLQNLGKMKLNDKSTLMQKKKKSLESVHTS